MVKLKCNCGTEITGSDEHKAEVAYNDHCATIHTKNVKRVKWLGDLEVETICQCKKPDWVTTLAAKKNQYFLQCDNCKEYGFRDGSVVVIELIGSRKLY